MTGSKKTGGITFSFLRDGKSFFFLPYQRHLVLLVFGARVPRRIAGNFSPRTRQNFSFLSISNPTNPFGHLLNHPASNSFRFQVKPPVLEIFRAFSFSVSGREKGEKQKNFSINI